MLMFRVTSGSLDCVVEAPDHDAAIMAASAQLSDSDWLGKVIHVVQDGKRGGKYFHTIEKLKELDLWESVTR